MTACGRACCRSSAPPEASHHRRTYDTLSARGLGAYYATGLVCGGMRAAAHGPWNRGDTAVKPKRLPPCYPTRAEFFAQSRNAALTAALVGAALGLVGCASTETTIAPSLTSATEGLSVEDTLGARQPILNATVVSDDPVQAKHKQPPREPKHSDTVGPKSSSDEPKDSPRLGGVPVRPLPPGSAP